MLSKLGLVRLKQHFENRAIADLPAVVASEINKVWPKTSIKPGDKVALSVGSRGVANLALMVKTICQVLKEKGAQPVIIPAMGSHGGGTAEGQTDLLAHYGVTSEAMGAPVDARMNVKFIGRSPEGLKIYLAKSALEADHIIVFNRIKPHTDFRGDVESGLCKIMAIGLGKIAGASYYHRAVTEFGFANALMACGRHVLKNAKVAFGLGVVEDAHDQTALVEAILPDGLVKREVELLAIARSWMARLPFMNFDCLVVDGMGKNISGTGMDTNITGRFRNLTTPDDLPEPRIKRIYTRSLTPDSGGNATGMGRADFVSRRLYQQINFPATYINCQTSLSMENARLPMVCANDREALEFMKNSCGLIHSSNLRLIWIRDTLHLADVLISKALVADCQGRADLSLGDPLDVQFDAEGWLPAKMV